MPGSRTYILKAQGLILKEKLSWTKMRKREELEREITFFVGNAVTLS